MYSTQSFYKEMTTEVLPGIGEKVGEVTKPHTLRYITSKSEKKWGNPLRPKKGIHEQNFSWRRAQVCH